MKEFKERKSLSHPHTVIVSYVCLLPMYPCTIFSFLNKLTYFQGISCERYTNEDHFNFPFIIFSYISNISMADLRTYVVTTRLKRINGLILFPFRALSATAVDVLPSSLYCNSHYTFRPNWPSSAVQVVCLRELVFCFSVVPATSYFYVGNVLQPCTFSIYL
jgi:hypothetical protein